MRVHELGFAISCPTTTVGHPTAVINGACDTAVPVTVLTRHAERCAVVQQGHHSQHDRLFGYLCFSTPANGGGG